MADTRILIEVKNDVKFKKIEGSLRLLKNKLTWTQKDESTPKIEILYSEIKGKRFFMGSTAEYSVLYNT